ncbi:MAG: FtsX-like permease family protein [Vicinamibacteria bacterium]
MRALDRKLIREVWRLRGQMISIALVVASGVMTVVTMRGTYESLSHALDRYYRDYRFADVWSGLKRAPESLRASIEKIDGVAQVSTRVTFNAILDIPSQDAPALGRFVSVPERREPMLNDVHLSKGRYVAQDRPDEAIISSKFAAANGFAPGSTLRTVINGRQRTLHIVGIGMSPEHGYAVPPGSLYPDDERYGVIWMSRHELGPAYDMEGAFNDVAVTLAPGADAVRVKEQLNRVLEPYGGVGAYGRDQQLSAKILGDEVAQLQTMGSVIPAIFLGVAAFLLHLVIGRLIATQRTEIAVLKAFGYTNLEVGTHYLRFALVAVVAGAILGTGAGFWLGGAMVELYRAYFEFPSLTYELRWGLVALGVGISVVAASLGALGAVQKAVSLPPAEAMRPESPARFRAGPLERSGLGSLLPTVGRMILRNLERQPIKAAFASVGVAFSVAILMVGMFTMDGVTYMMDLQFGVGQKEDLSLTFNQPLSTAVRYDLAALPGVQKVELFRSLPVRLKSQQREREVGFTGLSADSTLRRIVTARGGVQVLPPEGLVLSALLAEQLQVGPGDSLEVKVLDGARRTGHVTIAAVVEDFLGVTGYMESGALHRLAGEGPVASGAYLTVDAHQRPAVMRRLKRMPAVASVASPAQMLASFQTQLAGSLFVAVAFLVGFSSIIAVAVIYNGARIALSERGRELASLRVFGFTKREVSAILFGEQAILTFLAIPIGWALGYTLAGSVATSLRSETYRIPLVISASTYLWSALVVLGAAGLSSLLVRRRLNQLDLIGVLKTRE